MVSTMSSFVALREALLQWGCGRDARSDSAYMVGIHACMHPSVQVSVHPNTYTQSACIDTSGCSERARLSVCRGLGQGGGTAGETGEKWTGRGQGPGLNREGGIVMGGTFGPIDSKLALKNESFEILQAHCSSIGAEDLFFPSRPVGWVLQCP